MYIYPASAVMLCWLFCAAEPAAGAAEVVAAAEAVVGAAPHDHAPQAGASACPGRLVPKRLVARCAYVGYSRYVPGTIPNPSGSWSRHAYLAYRGNYFLHGYDYRTGRDYPWHPCPSSRRSWPPVVQPPEELPEVVSPGPPQLQTDGQTSPPAAPLP